MASKFWELSNEDSKAVIFRAAWEQNNKGSWQFSPQYGFTWNPEEVITEEPVKTPKKKRVTKSK